jgi:hypothetical protein
MRLSRLGVRDYTARYASGMRAVLAEQGPMPSFEEPETLDLITRNLEKQMPIETLNRNKQWREQQLAELQKLKKRLAQQQAATGDGAGQGAMSKE